MKDTAKHEIEERIASLTTPLELVFVSGMAQMAYELQAITEDERAEYLAKASEKLAQVAKNRGR